MAGVPLKGDVTVKSDRTPLLLRAIEDLTGTVVLVGIPGDAAPRYDGSISNAALGFIHEFGTAHIPARPFLRPGIQSDIDGIVGQLRSGAMKALSHLEDHSAGKQALTAVGLRAQNAVRRYINKGVPPPLAASTLRARMAAKGRPRKGARLELQRRMAGGLAGVDLAKPLVWTGQLRNSVTFVLRKRA